MKEIKEDKRKAKLRDCKNFHIRDSRGRPVLSNLWSFVWIRHVDVPMRDAKLWPETSDIKQILKSQRTTDIKLVYLFIDKDCSDSKIPNVESCF